MTDRAVQRRRRALYLFFFLNGIAMSSWVTRTPDIRDRLGVSTAQMGLVLFGLSVGSMTGILCSGRLVSRFGTRPVTAVGTLLIVASVAVVGAGSARAMVEPAHRADPRRLGARRATGVAPALHRRPG
ncbi:MFS transporter, partial [Streptomyces violaceoruber]